MQQAMIDVSEFDFETIQMLAGHEDSHFKTIEREFPVRIRLKASEIILEAETDEILDDVIRVFQDAIDLIDESGSLDTQELARLCTLAKKKQPAFDAKKASVLLRCRSGKVISPKTANQQILVDAFTSSDMVFASGVAGTGKTYLAVAYAVSQLKKEKINKIILTRPAVEAGESLGFLPGDMKEKVDPYLRPLYDALNEMLGAEAVEKLVEKEVIEIAPLAFMRGRTLNEAVVILDEAQNTTRSQMKMFLTRMGKRCQMIINGDISQIDLIKKKDSGLLEATRILEGIEGISIVYLDEADVVRNPLVQKVIERYAKEELRQEQRERRRHEEDGKRREDNR